MEAPAWKRARWCTTIRISSRSLKACSSGFDADSRGGIHRRDRSCTYRFWATIRRLCCRSSEYDFSQLVDDHPPLITYDIKWNPPYSPTIGCTRFALRGLTRGRRSGSWNMRCAHTLQRTAGTMRVSICVLGITVSRNLGSESKSRPHRRGFVHGIGGKGRHLLLGNIAPPGHIRTGA